MREPSHGPIRPIIPAQSGSGMIHPRPPVSHCPGSKSPLTETGFCAALISTCQQASLSPLSARAVAEKSTLLRILVGLDSQTQGTLAFEDADGHESAANAHIVFQEPRLLPWLSVLENVAVGLGPAGDTDEGKVRAGRVLSEVQLGEKSAEWPSRLSGGQRQRVALARALVSQPGILALDEPLGALDALTRISMQQLLSRVWQETGFTAVLVTHDVSEAVHLADRVIVLDEGRITLDLPVPFPHPRRHGNPELARLEARLLSTILGTEV